MLSLRADGLRPYFIPGGGHGNLGTRAYDLVCDEIADQEKERGVKFDYIFLPSGTGTTQAGLICGQKRLGEARRKIVGISVARPQARGGQVVLQSVHEYLGSSSLEDVIFEDRYICGGYGKFDDTIEKTIRALMARQGIPLDPIYTGKAFSGMLQFLQEKKVSGQNILFIHTGGTPLFFDWLENIL